MRDQALTVRDVAARLSIRQHGVLALIRSGELPAVDVSRRGSKRPTWRVLPDDLDAFLARRTHRAAPPRRRRRKLPPYKQYF